MADVLDDIPCEGPLEPDLLVPKSDYEECDTCSPYPEKPVGDDVDVDALMAELAAASEKSAEEADAYVKKITECVAGMSSKVDALREEGERVAAVMETRGMLDELVDNMALYMYYHERRSYYYSMRGKPVPGNAVSTQEMLQLLMQIENHVRQYSTAISLGTTFSTASGYSPGARNLKNWRVKCKNTNRLNESNYIFLSDALENYGEMRITKEIEAATFSGSLYTEYYNKLEDPLNNFFTREERGLTSQANDADSEFKNIAATQGLSISDIASAKQGNQTLYISDQQKYTAFFKSFKKTFDDRMAQVRSTRVGPAFEYAKSKLDRIARYEAALEQDESYSKNCIAHFQKITSERDRLKSMEDDFNRKTAIDPNNPGASEFAMNLKKDVSCLGGEEPSQEEPMEFEGDVVKTFAYGDGGMDPYAPTPAKMCYWNKFAKLATIYGLLPFPDTSNGPAIRSLRYWPVGLVIPIPGKLIKIPTPVVWFPLTAIMSPFGTVVVFLGVAGLIPCPYVLYISRTGEKKFIITMRGQSEVFGYLPKEDDKGYPLKVCVPLSSTLTDLPEQLLGMLNESRSIGMPPFDEFVYEVTSKVEDAIDRIGLPELKGVGEVKNKIKKYGASAGEKRDAIRGDISEWLGGLDLPKITLPKDPARRKQSNIAAKTIDSASEFMSNKLFFDTPKMFDLKEKIMPKILDLEKDPLINREIRMLPENLDLEVSDHWQAFKDFTTKCVNSLLKLFIPDEWTAGETYGEYARVMHDGKAYVSMKGKNKGNEPMPTSEWWSRVDELMQSMTMTPSITIPNPYACREELAVPPADLPYIAAVGAAFNGIRGIVDRLDASTVTAMLGMSRFNTESVLTMVYAMIDSAVPELPLPGDNFKVDYISVFRKMLLDSLSLDLPKVPLVDALVNGVTIDLNVLKPVIRDFVARLIDEVIKLLPVDILRNDSMGFPALDGVTLKIAVKAVLSTVMEKVMLPVKPAYDAVSVASGIARLVKNEKSPLDAALMPQAVAAEKVKAQIKALVDAIKTPMDDTMVLDQRAFEMAMNVLKNFNVPYQAVGAMAAFGLSDYARKLHPLMYAEDLPPWERLNFKNLLFVLFLDEFCHTAKKHGGLYENFLP